jgi:NAD(P)-dependent dehydrogenase (short-subunit alcohol dehydrogenase family)
MNIALVTGASKGIGREVARQLASRGLHVYLSARDAKAGEAAAKEIAKEGGKVSFLRMDVADEQSVEAAALDLSEMEERLDVLVNNAGIVAEGDSNILDPCMDRLRLTMETNTFGPLRVVLNFRALLAKAPAPRIINVSSGAGQLTDGADGWAPCYCISKTALNGVTSQLATALPKYAVNSVCPGWVRTDMGGAAAPRTVEQGADTIVWLATEAPHDLTGKFLRDRAELPW